MENKKNIFLHIDKTCEISLKRVYSVLYIKSSHYQTKIVYKTTAGYKELYLGSEKKRVESRILREQNS